MLFVLLLLSNLDKIWDVLFRAIIISLFISHQRMVPDKS